MKKQRAGRAHRPSRRPCSCRTWGKERPAEDRERSRQGSLEVLPGERIHEVVLSDLGGGRVLNILAKERVKDGKTKVLMKVEEPDGECSALPWPGWIRRRKYRRVARAVMASVDESGTAELPSEKVNAALAKVANRMEYKARRKKSWGPGELLVLRLRPRSPTTSPPSAQCTCGQRPQSIRRSPRGMCGQLEARAAPEAAARAGSSGRLDRET